MSSLYFLELVTKAGFSCLGLIIFGFVVYLIMNRKVVNRNALLWTIATAIKFDMPLPDLIRAQARGAWGQRRQMLLSMADSLREGNTLAEVIDTFWLLVPEQGRLAIHVGTETGTLSESLDAALEKIERQPTGIINNFLILYFYLAFIAFIGLQIVGFIMYWIVPKFIEIFWNFGIELPQVTLLLIQVTDFLTSYFYLLVPLLLLFFPLTMIVLTRITASIDAPDRAYAKVPFRLRYIIPHLFWRVISPFLKFSVRFSPRRASSDILRYLAVSAQADRPLLAAIDSLAKHHKASDIRSRLQVIKTRLQEGGELWKSLRAKGFISSQKASLLKTAEAADGLAYALQEKSLEYERGDFHHLVLLLEWLRIFFVLTLCFITAFIAVSMFYPIVHCTLENSFQ